MKRALGFLLATMAFSFPPLVFRQDVLNAEELVRPKMAMARAQLVSLIQLLVDPEAFHGRSVRVAGYYIRGEEESALYLTQEDAKYGIVRNAVWIDLGRGFLAEHDVAGLTRKHVMLEGAFSKDRHGHLGLYQGTIENVTEAIVLEARNQ
jgi:hypothetical protein